MKKAREGSLMADGLDFIYETKALRSAIFSFSMAFLTNFVVHEGFLQYFTSVGLLAALVWINNKNQNRVWINKINITPLNFVPATNVRISTLDKPAAKAQDPVLINVSLEI